MPRVKNKSFGLAANRNQPQHRLKLSSNNYTIICAKKKKKEKENWVEMI